MMNDSQVKRLHALGIAIITIYCLLFALSYLADPMAQAPQLDAKENLQIASQFAEKTSIEAPFYRAVFYPYILHFFQPENTRPLWGLLFGIICHLVNGFLVWKIAGFIWKSYSGGMISAGLYLINPVVIFYSVQLMDVTLGITLFLGATLAILTSRSFKLCFLGGLLLGLAVVTRPHFLPPAFVIPLIIIIIDKSRYHRTLSVYSTLLLVLVFQGFVNLNLSGEFRILPWQGSYNLYAANCQSANGLHYMQTMDVSGLHFTNPARAESEVLFRQDTGKLPPYDVSEFNQYWKEKAFQQVLDSPSRILKLWMFKVYAVLNSNEQYNNLTYSYHKDRLLLLRFNPINWGVILLLSIAGSILLIRQDKKLAISMFLIIAAYAATLVLYYANARFRLPLVPLLTILSGGVACCFKDILTSRILLIQILAASVVTGIITFSSFGGIRDKTTYVQDRLLLANAHSDTGNDTEAAKLAQQVLQEHPHRTEAQRIYTISYFNLQLIQSPNKLDFGNWSEQRQWVTQDPPTDPVQDAVLGVYLWNWGSRENAVKIWNGIMENAREESVLANACLQATGNSQGESQLSKALKNILK